MVGAGFRFGGRFSRLRLWAAGLCAAGLPLLAAGCSQHMGALTQLGAIPTPRRRDPLNDAGRRP